MTHRQAKEITIAVSYGSTAYGPEQIKKARGIHLKYLIALLKKAVE